MSRNSSGFRYLSLILLPALPASSRFLVPDKPYRCKATDANCELPAFKKYNGFTINFVEFKDSGQAWNDWQTEGRPRTKSKRRAR